MVAPTPSGYSARVNFILRAGGQQFFPAQIGGSQIVFETEVVLPGTGGELVAEIDEHRQQWHVTWDADPSPRRKVRAEYQEVEYRPIQTATTTSSTSAK